MNLVRELRIATDGVAPHSETSSWFGPTADGRCSRAPRLLLEPNQVRGVNLVREFRTATDAGAPHSETSSRFASFEPARRLLTHFETRSGFEDRASWALRAEQQREQRLLHV